MAEAHKEPTMEEILASIRRIISEDDPAPESAAPAAVLALEPEAALDPEEEMILEEDVMDLSEPEPERVEAPQSEDDFTFDAAPASEDYGDVVVMDAEEDDDLMMEEVFEAAAPAPTPPPVVRAPEPPAPKPNVETLISDDVASAAAGSITKLLGSMAFERSNSVEGLVREMLKPMLKEWLDQNLPRIVEAKVEEEMGRIVRMVR